MSAREPHVVTSQGYPQFLPLRYDREILKKPEQAIVQELLMFHSTRLMTLEKDLLASTP